MRSEYVWYVSYGSNMNARRLSCYLEGGCPPGAKRSYPGARDHTPPRGDAAVMLRGRLYFGLASTVWGGGIAFYDHQSHGPTPGRAYLITVEQFADIAAQEMHRAPKPDNRLEAVVRSGLPRGRHVAGPGHYETLLRVGERDGAAMLTFTAPGHAAEMDVNQPSEAYLEMLSEGLAQSHGWDRARSRRYFASCGVRELVA